MSTLQGSIDALDVELFRFVQIQATASDARSLLGLHAAVAAGRETFAYLEIGSYRGGSLQVLIRDPRCHCLMSIDPRTDETPDETRGAYTYEDNTTARMVELLAAIPDADMSKLRTFDTTTAAMKVEDLPCRPDCCFIDGEHSDEAVLCDARFCLEAIDGAGIIAFHDYGIVRPAIRSFLREQWSEFSYALALNVPGNPKAGHGVFAIEVGDTGILARPVVQRAIASRSHSLLWRAANRPRGPVQPFLAAWAALPVIDAVLDRARGGRRRRGGR